MTSIRYALLDKHFHPEHDRLAKLRALYWIALRRHETEICWKCGRPVDVVWWCSDQKLFDEVNGGPNGSLCIPCFDVLARPLTSWLEWTPLNLRHLTFGARQDAPVEDTRPQSVDSETGEPWPGEDPPPFEPFR